MRNASVDSLLRRRANDGTSVRSWLQPWMLVAAAWLGPAMLGAVNSIAQSRLSHDPTLTAAEVLFESGDWLLYALFTPGIFAVARRWPVSRVHGAGRVAIHVLFSLLFCAAWAGAGTVLRIALIPRSVGPSVTTSYVSWLFTTFPFGVAVYFAVVGIEHAVRYFTEARDRDIQVARLSQQLVGARLSALQAQLNPHFLFNSLNTVAVLVRDGNARGATDVIEQLSDVLRRTLGRTNANEVALDDELELVRQYLAVEQARFSDRLRATITVDAALNAAAVPAFALQHLVENAVRHGIARRTNAGAIAIAARRDDDTLELTVSDDGAGMPSDSPPPTEHGIANTRERLRTLYGERASLALLPQLPHGTIAILRIPYHEIVVDTARAVDA